jgi:hypothetical protein
VLESALATEGVLVKPVVDVIDHIFSFQSLGWNDNFTCWDRFFLFMVSLFWFIW